MAKFWSERIAYDLNRIDEVPAKLREKVKNISNSIVKRKGFFF